MKDELGEVLIRIIPSTAPSEMLHTAVRELLADEEFKIRSSLSRSAVSTAASFLSWSEVNDNTFKSFSTEIVCDLEVAFSHVTSTLRHRVQREKMWGYYHVVRSSLPFRQKWIGILEKIPGCEPSPIFFQYVTDNMFRQLLKIRFPITTVQSTHQHSGGLTAEEASGLRYAAGYVCRTFEEEVQNQCCSD